MPKLTPAQAVLHNKELVRNGKMVVNHIGATTYISFDDVSSKEFEDLAILKKHLGDVV